MIEETSKHLEPDGDEMLPEYDFKNGIRGKHFEAYRSGHKVKISKNAGTTSVQYFKLEYGAVML